MLKIEKKPKEKMEIYGTEFDLSVPTVKQIKSFHDASKTEGFDEFKISVDFLIELGFPKELIDELTADDFKSVIEHVFNPKKK